MSVLIWVQTVYKVICRGQNLSLARKELRVKVIHLKPCLLYDFLITIKSTLDIGKS